MEPEKTCSPDRRDLKPDSLEVSEPPDAVGTPPPMSSLKCSSERRPRRRKAAMSATRRTTSTIMTMTMGLTMRP